jgi:hypothetical protein
MEGSHDRSWSFMEPMGSSPERGKRGNEEGEGRGVAGLLLGGA